MSGQSNLTDDQLDRLRRTASVLLPAARRSPDPGELPGFDEYLHRAASALDQGDSDLASAIAALPEDVTWASLSSFSSSEPDCFEQVALIVVGAYFMTPSVLEALGIPTGARRPADREQVVDELSSGILDPVFERGCPVRDLDDVNRSS